MEFLADYHWPGNIRQLENAIEGISAESVNGEITLQDIKSFGLEKNPRIKDARKFYEQMTSGEGNFWSVVYTPYMARSIDRDMAKEILALSLEEAKGSYKIVCRLVNIEQQDYKRFLNFIRKHKIQLPFQEYRG